MPDLCVQELGADQLADAYPLVRTAVHVSQRQWEEFGADLLAGGGSILAVTAADGCVLGVAAFRPAPDLRRKRSLEVQVFVAFELQGGDRVRETLYDALEQAAAELCCRSVGLTLPARGCVLSKARKHVMDRGGLQLETIRFVRDLCPAVSGKHGKAPRRDQ